MDNDSSSQVINNNHEKDSGEHQTHRPQNLHEEDDEQWTTNPPHEQHQPPQLPHNPNTFNTHMQADSLNPQSYVDSDNPNDNEKQLQQSSHTPNNQNNDEQEWQTQNKQQQTLNTLSEELIAAVADEPAAETNHEPGQVTSAEESPVIQENLASSNPVSIRVCCSCQSERATIICSTCTTGVGIKSAAAGSTDKLPTASQNQKCTPISLDNGAEEVTSVSIEPAAVAPTTTPKINIESLIANGNMLYCDECFKCSHPMNTNHTPIDYVKSKKDKPDEIAPVYVENNNEEQLVNDELREELSETSPVTPVNPCPPQQDIPVSAETAECLPAAAPIDKDKMRGDLRFVLSELASLNRRYVEFNSVKQSIKQMNDVVRDDIILDFLVTENALKSKLAELTVHVKERLKDAYSTVRDIQDRVRN
jgi:hypothetical protein